jgi:cysteinyl-tRNA synthetase
LWDAVKDRLSPEALARPHQFDIHGGGLDLIFPHHENEIAQSRCAHGTHAMANVWMHNGFVQVEGRKMSKSEGNFVTIHDLLHTDRFGGRKWPGEVLRLAMLMTHYREPIDFSRRRLEEAENLWKACEDSLARSDEGKLREVRPTAVEAVLCNDLDTYSAVTIVRELSDVASSTGDASELFAALGILGFVPPLGDYIAIAGAALKTVASRPEIVSRVQKGEDVDAIAAEIVETARRYASYEIPAREIFLLVSEGVNFSANNSLIEARSALIAQKNWAEADRIRDELLAQGIQLKDGKDPVTGERITTWEVKR